MTEQQDQVELVRADLTGTTIGRFVVNCRLGAGGMGEVYRAEDSKLKRSVALKRLAPHLRNDPNYRQRLLNEGQRASALNNPHIASIYELVEDKGEFFLAFEYVEGATLRQRLHQSIQSEGFLDVAVQCAEGLVAAHEKGIVHGDIKPENIMVTPAGQVKILDFGVAKDLTLYDEDAATQSRVLKTESLRGTPAYMSPEVLLGQQPDGRADLFALGVVFYELLTARHPFLAPTFPGTVDRILHEIPEPPTKTNPGLPPELDRIVVKTLAKDKAERYGTATELLADLQAVRHGSFSAPLRPTRRRLQFTRRQAAASLAVAAIALAAFLGAAPLQQRIKLWLFPVPAMKQLAVLPFDAVGGDSQSKAFADGLTETLTAKLTQLTERDSLQVVPADEVRSKAVTTSDEAHKQFGVNLVLRGSLQRSGDDVRINCFLVDATANRILRADGVTAKAADPFSVQDQVVRRVLDSLAIELQPQERLAMNSHGTNDPQAYDNYLQGRGYLQEYQRSDNTEKAIGAFQDSLKRDPNYALAYAGLGEAYWRHYQQTKDSNWVKLATANCSKAVAADDHRAAGHTCLGLVYNGTGDYDQAAQQFEIAVEQEPTSDSAYGGLASAYEHMGRPDEAEKTYRLAISKRPHYPAGYNWLGGFYFRQGRYSEAEQQFSKSINLAPDSFVAYSNLVVAYLYQGHYKDAIDNFQQSLNILRTADAYSNLAMAYFDMRQFDEAAKNYEKAVKLDDRDYEVWGNLGDAYYWTPGQRAKATHAYETAISLAEKKLKVNPRDATLLGYLAVYHAMLASKENASTYLAKALPLAQNDPELLFDAALVHYQLGDTNQALACLEKALAAGFSPTQLHDTPNFASLSTDPRFQSLLGSHLEQQRRVR